MSLRRYDSFQESGAPWVGRVPAHWTVQPLKAVASHNDDVLHEDTNPEQEIDYVEISGVDEVRGIVETAVMLFGEAPSRARRRVAAGDVLISTVRTYLRAIAPVAKPPENLVASTGFAVVRPRQVSSRFLGYALRSEAFIAEVISRSVGVSYPAINASELARIALPLPPRPEQAAIAAFLDRETLKIDALVEDQRRLIELLKEKRQAVISQAMTKGLDASAPTKESGVEWLGKVPEEWEITRLKRIKAMVPNAFVDGPFGSNLKSEHYIDDGDVYVIESGFATTGTLDEYSLKTITEDHFQTITRSEASAGDIIIAKIGAYFGKSSVLPPLKHRAVISGNTLKLTVNCSRCSPEWALWQLRNLKDSGEIDLLANGSAQPALSLGAMNELVFLLPPREVQEQILVFINGELAQLERLMVEASAAISLLNERRAALISAAVTGKIDVRSLVGPVEAEAA